MLFKKRSDKGSKPGKDARSAARREPELASATPTQTGAALAPLAAGEPTPASTRAAEHVLSPPLIVVSQIEQLEFTPGRKATGKAEGGWIQLGSKDGGRTVESFPAHEGEVFVGIADTVLIDDGENGYASKFMFGPMFLDADEKVLTWWKPFAKPSSSPTEITASATAPAGTRTVRLGVRGTYDSKGETGDYIVGFANARLAKVIG